VVHLRVRQLVNQNIQWGYLIPPLYITLTKEEMMKKLLVLPVLIGVIFIASVSAETRFIDDGKGIIADRQSGLEWDTNLAAEKTDMTALRKWDKKDHKGWRLPKDNEIKTLYDIVVEKSPFSKMKAGYYWSVGPALVDRDVARGFGCFGIKGQERHSNSLYYLMPVREINK
jgi:hypothetical protein